ncbi:heme acquisition protein HasA [Pseudoalteromonas luteoviolacea]|uniref:heme acquisition protein HasA n=1 Tax=Pseudoalteromonas luteoviolacea TaxID=43657 RepID=UPI001F158614|nr:heme acquisition protein HasA [Pseudoalteromonas luteoviolacea]MCF6440909.1 heme acquisition protein HasA [Pseudoalteromonas luteoviolacea]
MSIQVTYSASYSFSNLDSFFGHASQFFTNTDYNENIGSFAGAENPNPTVDLGFWGLFGTFSGTQYAQEGQVGTENLGFIIQAADGSYIDYTFFAGPSHTMYGEIASISFGRGLTQGANGEYSFTEDLVSFDGLDTINLNAGFDANGGVIGRHEGTNTTHNIVDGMKDSDFGYLMTVLSSNGIELTANDTVGVSSLAEFDLVA